METPKLLIPFDPYGNSEENWKTDAFPVEEYGIVFPDDGAFYTASVEVYDENDNLLKPNLDWEPLIPSQEGATETGQSVNNAIIIKKKDVSTVTFNRQILGGKYGHSSITFKDIVALYRENKAMIPWDQIIVPDSGVKAEHHTHLAEDLKGTQELNAAIGLLRETLIELQLNPNREAIKQNTSRHDANDERVSDLEGELSRTNSNYLFLNQSYDSLVSLINNLSRETKKNANTIAYDHTVLNDSATITRRHQVTVIDKFSAKDTILNINYIGFTPGDTLELNASLSGDFTTTVTFGDGKVINSENSSLNKLSRTGLFSLKLRYLGEKHFQMMP